MGICHAQDNVDRESTLHRVPCLRSVLPLLVSGRWRALVLVHCRSDGLKLYPTLVIRGTGLYELWKRGLYKNYPPHMLVDLVARYGYGTCR